MTRVPLDVALGTQIRQTLIEHAVDVPENQGLHSWRCQYPDLYGPCSCFDGLANELTSVCSAILLAYTGGRVTEPPAEG